MSANDGLRGYTIAKKLDFLKRAQFWSSEEKIYQDESLRKLIHHSYHTVPYYRKIFKERGIVPEDIRSTEDLLKLPVISKETIINNFNDFVSSKNKKRIFGRTGGTTGNPFKYISSKDNISEMG